LDDPETNPFVRYRKLLWSWSRAVESGWTDADFIEMVTAIDEAVAAIDGTGFAVTPCGEWVGADERLPPRVTWKDETNNVSGSHKARHLMGLLLHLAVDAVADDKPLAIASCGNAALGAATVARAAGRRIDVFIPAWAEASVVSALDSLGSRIHVCERRADEEGDPCMLRFKEAVDAGALPFGVQATENRWTLDGGRTVGWELADQTAADPLQHAFVQVGGGALLTSLAIGLIEGVSHGPLEASPAVWAVQAEGCAPFDRAWRGIPNVGTPDERLAGAGPSLMKPWINPRSAASGILDDVTYDWLGVARALLVTGGDSIVAPEPLVEVASEIVASLGIDADATGTAGLAGLMTAVATGRIDRGHRAAVLLTGRRRG
jgi:threonine synthase